MKFVKNSSKVYCLFEQSGTFKRAFLKQGIEAFDFDLENDFDETDGKYNIFTEIQKELNPIRYKSIFSYMNSEDLIFAFFPCTYFSDQSLLVSRSDGVQMQGYSLQKKIMYTRKNMERRAEYYRHLCDLVEICLKRDLRLIIENPYGKCNFLKLFFPIKPTIIHYNRQLYGDYFRKPTQYFFINCEPPFNLESTTEIDYSEKKVVQEEHGFDRSKISQNYADNFVKNYILES